MAMPAHQECGLHHWDLLGAPRLSLTQVKARLRAGWTLAALPPEQRYCSAGGVGLYSHYLHSPDGELAQLTDKCLAALALPQPAPEVALDMSTIALDVPFDEKGDAKALGARWDPTSRKWHIQPAQAPQFARWLPPA